MRPQISFSFVFTPPDILRPRKKTAICILMAILKLKLRGPGLGSKEKSSLYTGAMQKTRFVGVEC